MAGFDRATVRRLEHVLHHVWDCLPAVRRKDITKGHVAQRIIELARRGERDPVQLRDYAVLPFIETNEDTSIVPGQRP